MRTGNVCSEPATQWLPCWLDVGLGTSMHHPVCSRRRVERACRRQVLSAEESYESDTDEHLGKLMIDWYWQVTAQATAGLISHIPSEQRCL